MKKKVSYTIEECVVDTFNQVSRMTALNKSKWLENMMIEEIKKVAHLDSLHPITKYIKGV